MKKIKFNKEEFMLPQSWEEVTLAMQIKANDDVKQLADDEVIKRIALLSGFCNIPIDVLKTAPMSEINKMKENLAFAVEPIDTNPITEFEFKGQKYSVIPSMMNSQFQDFVSCEIANENNKESPYKALPLILAILARTSEDETIDDYDVGERAKLFEELPMTVVEPLKVFFYQIGNLSLINSQLSSIQKLRLQISAKGIELINTLNGLRGGGRLRNWLIGILQRWTTYLLLSATKSLTTTQSNS